MPAVVDVWEAHTDVSTRDLCRSWSVLSDQERSRAGRLRHGHDRRAYVVTRALLRSVLGGVLGRAAHQIHLVQPCGNCGAPHGKPRLAGVDVARRLQFSVSHSGGLALIAACATGDVGVDVEVVPPPATFDCLPLWACSTEERRDLEGMPPARRVAAFYSLWTKKEAYLKGRGVGLLADLDRVHVLPHAGGVHTVAEGTAKAWTVVDLAIPGAAAAVAVDAADIEIRRHRRDAGT
jgi:4'-phosphopantetheinyl transferase